VTDNQADFEIQAVSVSVLHLSFCAECGLLILTLTSSVPHK